MVDCLHILHCSVMCFLFSVVGRREFFGPIIGAWCISCERVLVFALPFMMIASRATVRCQMNRMVYPGNAGGRVRGRSACNAMPKSDGRQGGPNLPLVLLLVIPALQGTCAYVLHHFITAMHGTGAYVLHCIPVRPLHCDLAVRATHPYDHEHKPPCLVTPNTTAESGRRDSEEHGVSC